MKIVIKISDQKYKWIVENPQTYTGKLHDAIRNGTPLPEHHGDLIDRNELIKRFGVEDATKYGNETAEQQTHSYSTMMMYEIADVIDDADAIIEAEGSDS